MGKVLAIAEKPSVAVNLAKVLGATERKDGYFEGNDYIVSFVVGHIVSLYDSEDYDKDMAKWELSKFPFIPSPFKYKISQDKAKLFKTIKSLVERDDVTEIINCMDYDREGDAIFYLLTLALSIKKPIKRMLINEWTPSEIKKGMSSLKPIAEMKSLQDAGHSRILSDWLIGINFTSVATLKYGNGDLLNIGRVIMPTVKLIYDREMAISNFIPENYFELWTTFKSIEGEYKGIYTCENGSRFESIKEIENILECVRDKQGSITNKKITVSNQFAPTLFNLTDLQGHITSKHSGWSSDKVLKVCQNLYENQFITYPRTKSRHLEDSLMGKAEKVLETLKQGLPYADKIRFHKEKRVFDNSKVEGHSAIIPTYVIPKGLGKDDEIVYTAIRDRFIACFMPPAKYENTEIITSVSGYAFLTKGKILIDKGFLELYGKEEGEDLLPNVNENDTVNVIDAESVAKQTKPPKHYTEGTLLKSMENCGKRLSSTSNDSLEDNDSNEENINLSDEDLKQILSGFSIGTEATRAEILSKIQQAGYVIKDKKNFLITEKGKRLIDIFPVKELLDVTYTGKLEKTLSDIQKGTHAKDEYLKNIINFTIKGVELMKTQDGKIGDGTDSRTNHKVLGKCPSCGKDIIEGKKGYGCSGYKDGCKFVLWKEDRLFESLGKKLTESIVKSVLTTGKCTLKGIKSKKGDFTYDTELYYVEKEDKRWGWEFPKKSNDKNDNSPNNFPSLKVIGKCSVCESNVVVDNFAYKCSNPNCDFKIWKNDKFLARFRVTMTDKIAKEIINTGKVHIDKMYSESKKKDFPANLTYEKSGDYWGFKFDSF